MTLETARIGQIAVNVKDIDRAVAFYRDRLGLRFLFTAPPNMGFFDCGGVRLMLGVPTEPRFEHPSSILYFQVDDIAGRARGPCRPRAWRSSAIRPWSRSSRRPTCGSRSSRTARGT